MKRAEMVILTAENYGDGFDQSIADAIAVPVSEMLTLVEQRLRQQLGSRLTGMQRQIFDSHMERVTLEILKERYATELERRAQGIN